MDIHVKKRGHNTKKALFFDFFLQNACRFKNLLYLCSAIAKARLQSGRFQSGQMGQTVNLLRHRFGGSNPSLPTTGPRRAIIAVVAQLIEHQPSKLRVASLSLVYRSGSDDRC